MIQDIFCPTPTGPENIAVRESATGSQARDIIQKMRILLEVAHVQVPADETGPGERGRHLELPVDALLPENRDDGRCTGLDIGGGGILPDFIGQFGEKRRSAPFLPVFVLVAGTSLMIPAPGDFVAGPVSTTAQARVMARPRFPNPGIAIEAPARYPGFRSTRK